MNKTALTVLFMGLVSAVFGQRTLLEENLFNPKENRQGPNRRHYTQGYFGLGFGGGKAPSDYSEDIGGLNITLGLRQKIKTSQYTGIVFDLGYQYQEWKFNAIEQTPVVVSDFNSIEWRKNKLNLLEFAGNFRIKFNRGNNSGPAIDMGGGLLYNFVSSQKYRGRDSLNRQVNYTQRRWKPDNDIAFYYGIRLHLWSISVAWRQRFTPWIKSEDLPATTITMELNL